MENESAATATKHGGGRAKGSRHSYLNSLITARHKRLIKACRHAMQSDSIAATVETAIELLAAKLGVTVHDVADDAEV